MDIDKIILKAINDKANLEEYETLEKWKQESEQNLEYLNTLMNSTKENHIPYQQFDNNQAWDRISKNIDGNKKPYKFIGIAILIAILLGLGYLFLQKQANTYPKVHKTKSQMAELILNDNSEVSLNKETQLTVLSDFNEERQVTLSGEAFFNVTKDDTKPFQIQLDNSDYIKVVGTSFNLIHTSSVFDLTVYSGVVELHTLNRVLELKKNDRVSKINGAFVKYLNKESNLNSWKTKELIFENSPLASVFTALGDHYQVSFLYDKPIENSNCILRSKFTDQSLDQVMLELKKLFEFEYKINDKSVSISDLKCN